MAASGLRDGRTEEAACREPSMPSAWASVSADAVEASSAVRNLLSSRLLPLALLWLRPSCCRCWCRPS
eukprot:814677-Pyramimonas_sp.AAC.1